MIKRSLIIFLATFFFLFISNKFTYAIQAQADQGPLPQMWLCLKADQVGGQTNVPPPEVDVNLSGRGYPSLRDIYIVLCVPPATMHEPANNYKCTTGNSEYDRIIFGADLTSSVSPLSLEVPKGSSPPQTIQAIGDNVNSVVHMSNAEGHRNYAFFGVTISESQLAPGQGSSIQYGTFQFMQDPAECLSIRWDPYGRTFDSQSLEPISGVRVSLLDENKQLVVSKGLVNPQTTEADGQFNFFVPIKPGETGIFYFNPVPLSPLPHIFTDTPNLNPNYEKIYYDIYKPNDQIIEAYGVPEHRDIPLDPGTNPPYSANPVVISTASVRLGKNTRYEGAVSHPFSIVTLVGKTSGKEIARINADKNGDWEIVIPDSKIPGNELLKIKIIKVDLTTLSRNSPNNFISGKTIQFLSRLVRNTLSRLNNKVFAQGTNKAVADDEFQPIPAYVEGYAYDKDGNVIPNAMVNVKLEMSDGVYYQTTADDSGFFSIPPQNLPIFTYYLEFLPPDSSSSVKTSTAEFSQNNQEHLTANNVDLMAATKNGESLLPTEPARPTSVGENPPSVSDNPSFVGNNLNLILTVIVIVVLLAVAGGVLMYIKKKESQPDNLL